MLDSVKAIRCVSLSALTHAYACSISSRSRCCRYREDIGQYLLLLEIFFTFVFSVEYALRVACLRQPRKFMLSMLGIIDLGALVPSYLGTSLSCSLFAIIGSY